MVELIQEVLLEEDPEENLAVLRAAALVLLDICRHVARQIDTQSHPPEVGLCRYSTGHFDLTRRPQSLWCHYGETCRRNLSKRRVVDLLPYRTVAVTWVLEAMDGSVSCTLVRSLS